MINFLLRLITTYHKSFFFYYYEDFKCYLQKLYLNIKLLFDRLTLTYLENIAHNNSAMKNRFASEVIKHYNHT